MKGLRRSGAPLPRRGWRLAALSLCLTSFLDLRLPVDSRAASEDRPGSAPTAGPAVSPAGAGQAARFVEDVAKEFFALSPAAAGQAAATRPEAGKQAIDLALCLEIARGRAKPDEDRCPGFLVSVLSGKSGAIGQCEEVGGRLVAVTPSDIRALDVNEDGKPEFLFQLDSNFGCDGAPSLFSCGSLGCPVGLYERKNGAWSTIGALDATADRPIEVMQPARNGYRQLRVGCYGDGQCEEFLHYQWTGAAYEEVERQVRGFGVDVSGSVHGLWTLVRETPVRATPNAGGRVLQRYQAGTEVAIIGQARGAPFYYVSPCNACESGFLEKSAVRRP